MSETISWQQITTLKGFSWLFCFLFQLISKFLIITCYHTCMIGAMHLIASKSTCGCINASNAKSSPENNANNESKKIKSIGTSSGWETYQYEKLLASLTISPLASFTTEDHYVNSPLYFIFSLLLISLYVSLTDSLKLTCPWFKDNR